jgi:hypothetical protein
VSSRVQVELAAAAPWRARAHAWIVRHDDSRWFLGLYLGLALVLSVAIGLFWLVALVAVHFAFEYVRFRHADAAPGAALGHALWELKLDVALVLFAFALTLYLQVVLGVLGIQAASRVGLAAQAGVRSGARFAAWENVIRGVVLSADDAVLGARALASVRKKAGGRAEVPVTGEPAPVDSAARAGWSTGDRIALSLGVLSLILIVAAPWVGHDGWSGVLKALASELHPFPG